MYFLCIEKCIISGLLLRFAEGRFFHSDTYFPMEVIDLDFLYIHIHVQCVGNGLHHCTCGLVATPIPSPYTMSLKYELHASAERSEQNKRKVKLKCNGNEEKIIDKNAPCTNSFVCRKSFVRLYSVGSIKPTVQYTQQVTEQNYVN